MKRRRALLFTFAILLALCAACGLWLHREQQQYARNRALIDALTHNDTKTALALVNAGADPNTQYTATPAPTLPQLLRQLLQHTPPPVNDSSTAFLIACGELWPMAAGGNINLDLGGKNLPLLRTMLAHGANVNAKVDEKRTALHDAVSTDKRHTAELLLQHGADVNAQNVWGTTPLFLTVWDRTPQVARLLLSHGANPNAQDRAGDTALHQALLVSTNEGLPAELLAHGADPNLPNKNGRTPLQLARLMKRPDLVRLLTRGGRQ